MQVYKDMVRYVMDNGVYLPNRTGVATYSVFSYFYRVNLADGYPLLTTKKMFFNSMVHELFWYLSGEEHIKDLRTKTKIWDAWADEEGLLETAYGRFWRRFPVPEKGLNGENWGKKWTHKDPETGQMVFDQIQYVIDNLKEVKNNPNCSAQRRLVVSAWHPANAAESKLPPCHYTYCFSVKAGKLNCHLTQRSGDIALGIPFNLSCYALLTMMLAKETGLKVGEFAHTIIDAHIYENHMEGLKEQLEREPLTLPKVEIADKPFDQLSFADIKLVDYESHPGIRFEVAV
ncbi:thymidylate synthase [Denitrovibrio acetiphilus DSM 12809]|uniref:Thymidylate synthase n=1 Tax=Denitrovibrio acetiphilus (strain DSM 12809 / NBRC 114555 / N2460) TaxID=522772 RepID=D4H816_DENA2|nr:thymidylate synthase [Denitrovibrio acetiphilus DSM 12809]